MTAEAARGVARSSTGAHAGMARAWRLRAARSTPWPHLPCGRISSFWEARTRSCGSTTGGSCPPLLPRRRARRSPPRSSGPAPCPGCPARSRAWPCRTGGTGCWARGPLTTSSSLRLRSDASGRDSRRSSASAAPEPSARPRRRTPAREAAAPPAAPSSGSLSATATGGRSRRSSTWAAAATSWPAAPTTAGSSSGTRGPVA
mmetsp:Transcript_115488/g.337810  ORF Transcript_115488/g.337810 Transcript_115488/m.337810 type:complete len:202 (+) Transcript_115488:668-1273(+)